MTFPYKLQKYFWEYDVDRPSWPESRETIVPGLLERGDLDAISWLRSRMTLAELRAFLRQRRGCGPGLRHLRFWVVVLDIPGNEIGGWISDQQGNPWNNRIP